MMEFLYQRDGEITVFGRPDRDVVGNG